MDTFLQQIINGLVLGSVYALVALGYTMVYGIIQLINFAHGEVVMIGCMVAFSVIVALAPSGMPPLAIVGLGIAAAVPVCMAVGYGVERVAYRPLRNAPRLAPLITAIGMSIVLQHLALMVWSRNIIAFPQIIELKLVHLGTSETSAAISNVQIAIIVISIAMMAGLLALVYLRRAIAMALDRNELIQSAFPPGYQVASFFTPCAVPNGCVGEPWYDFDLQQARDLLSQAGFPDGFQTQLSYRNVARGFLARPRLAAENIQAQLARNLNIKIKLIPIDSNEFLEAVDEGRLPGLFLLGWGADYPDASNFLDPHFSAGATKMFGTPFADISEPLAQALFSADEQIRRPHYESANNAIRQQAISPRSFTVKHFRGWRFWRTLFVSGVSVAAGRSPTANSTTGPAIDFLVGTAISVTWTSSRGQQPARSVNAGHKTSSTTNLPASSENNVSQPLQPSAAPLGVQRQP